MVEDGFESEGTVVVSILTGSGLGDAGTADAAGGSARTAAGALVGEEIGVRLSVAAVVNAAGLRGVAFDSCASGVAGAVMSDLGFNKLAAGLVGDEDSGRGAFEFVGVAAAGALVVTNAGEFELPAGWAFLPDRYREGPIGRGGFGAGVGEAASFFGAFASGSSFGNGGKSTGKGAAFTE